MATRTKWGFAGAFSIVVGLFWGCGGSLGSETGGESHFLIECVDSCGSGLNCISGVCTRGCVVDEDSCTDLHPGAECTDATIEPGEVAVCDLACTNDAECEDLGANFSCDSGQCRGDTAVVRGPSSSGDASSTTGGGGGGASATCKHLFEEHPDGTTFDNHAGCGTCTCAGGEVECDDSACQDGVPVFPCPADIHTDPLVVSSAFVQGDLLVLDVVYSGGCEIHDFGVCYDAGLAPATDVEAFVGELHVIHDSHGDPCEASPTTTVHFVLRPYAEYVMDELDVPGALVTTSLGPYAFGELSCDARLAAAELQPAWAAEQTLGYPCSTAEDCAWELSDLTCNTDCGNLIALGGRDRFETTLDHVETTVCGEGAELCEFPVVACEQPPTPACIEGRCVGLR